MTHVEAAGQPTVTYAVAWNLLECCDTSSTDTTCGFGSGTVATWSQAQKVTWSDTTTDSIKVSAQEGLVVEGLSEEITLSDQYTNGEERTVTLTETISTPCYATTSGMHFVNFTNQAAMYEVDVIITYTQCGEEKTMTGKVASSSIAAVYSCEVAECVGECSASTGCDAGASLNSAMVKSSTDRGNKLGEGSNWTNEHEGSARLV